MNISDLMKALKYRRDVSVMELRNRFGDEVLSDIDRMFKENFNIRLGVVWRSGSSLVDYYPEDEEELAGNISHLVGGYTLDRMYR